MTSRERFVRTLDFQPVDVPWVRAYSAVWPEAEAEWRKDGYNPEQRPHNEVLPKMFALDELIGIGPWYGPVPGFEYQVVEEDEEKKLFINHEGILMREFKGHSYTSMPQFVKFPVETAAEFEGFAAERLTLNPEKRFHEGWRNWVAAANHHTDGGDGSEPAEEHPRFCWAKKWGGFFGPLRNLMGLENLCCAFYDSPALIERMMEERADAIIAITEKVFEYTDFESFWYWEDMAYNHGSLIDPKLYRKFALKYYKKVNDWVRSKGIRHIGLDSDGDIRELIPLWLEAGVNILWPFEVQSGMDVVEIRKQYGKNLVIMGGIDKRELKGGGERMRREVDRVMPLVEQGGYIPEPDHSVPPDVSWSDFVEYVEYLKYRLGRG